MTASFKKDKLFAETILRGDEGAWRGFVERYTDWVLYTAWNFEKKYCRQEDKYNNCGLLTLMRHLKGEKEGAPAPQNSCDKGIDLYLWLLQYLRTRLKAYRGESKLSTFIWTILNSKMLYVDILRWKYGRMDEKETERLPVCLRQLSREATRVYISLKKGKDEESIRRELQLTDRECLKLIDQVREALSRAGQLHLIEVKEQFLPLEENCLPRDGGPQFLRNEEKLANRILYKEITARLSTALAGFGETEQRMLTLYYNNGLTGKEIVEVFSKAEAQKTIEGSKITRQNIYYLLGKLSQKLISMVDMELEGSRITQKQWQNILNTLKQGGFWLKR